MAIEITPNPVLPVVVPPADNLEATDPLTLLAAEIQPRNYHVLSDVLRAFGVDDTEIPNWSFHFRQPDSEVSDSVTQPHIMITPSAINLRTRSQTMGLREPSHFNLNAFRSAAASVIIEHVAAARARQLETAADKVRTIAKAIGGGALGGVLGYGIAKYNSTISLDEVSELLPVVFGGYASVVSGLAVASQLRENQDRELTQLLYADHLQLVRDLREVIMPKFGL